MNDIIWENTIAICCDFYDYSDEKFAKVLDPSYKNVYIYCEPDQHHILTTLCCFQPWRHISCFTKELQTNCDDRDFGNKFLCFTGRNEFSDVYVVSGTHLCYTNKFNFPKYNSLNLGCDSRNLVNGDRLNLIHDLSTTTQQEGVHFQHPQESHIDVPVEEEKVKKIRKVLPQNIELVLRPEGVIAVDY